MKKSVGAFTFFALCFAAHTVVAQQISSLDDRAAAEIQKNVNYLSDDKLEGRRAGTAGEILAGEYISAAFAKAGLKPAFGETGFFQPFEFPAKQSEANSVHSVAIEAADAPRKLTTGRNVAGMIDNGAALTIILGAHYDHLGYGEDHNSLYTGKVPQIHNGADDNASGTSALIELAKRLKASGSKKFNYVFAAFSGEELGLLGSKYFVEHLPVEIQTVNYMINMDMVGRLSDSTHGITIGGYGTSPLWSKYISERDPYFKINIDSSGAGPSDHTSFYRKDIPVLFFFTGSHKDYHKPSDDANLINSEGVVRIVKYIENIVAETADAGKLPFTKTREVSMGKSSFKVTLGVMLDYTFTGGGVLVEGISDDRPAQKAGVKEGDILVQLGEHKFSDVQEYMGALNKFNKGESTVLKLLRGKEEVLLPLTF